MSGSHFGTLDTLAEIERLTAERDKANAIIDELIACDELRLRGILLSNTAEGSQSALEYARRKPLAWEAAIAHRNQKEPT